MSNSEDSLTFSVILCDYGDIYHVFLVGGLVDIDETPMEAGTRYYRTLINFVQRSDILSLSKVLDGIKDLISIRLLL